MTRARGRLLRQVLIPVCLILGSATVTLLLGELLARSVVHPGDFLIATLVENPALGLRTAPNTTGHDALGFRNAEVPQRAAVVAIGDSMTYGDGVTYDSTWPRFLGNLLNEPIYNMSMGGYGPLQYL